MMTKKQLRVTLTGDDATSFSKRKAEAENALGIKLTDAQYAAMIIKKQVGEKK